MTTLPVIHTAQEIAALLPELDDHVADELETESLEFKTCPNERKLRELAVESAICLGNASGGTVVFGVRDRVTGRERAVVGIDFAPDLLTLQSSLYDSIDPKLGVQFEWLDSGSRRLLLMHVYPTMPPYTTTKGEGWIRIGKDCKPLTGSLRRQIEERAGWADPTPKSLPLQHPMDAVSAAALEILRREMRADGAPRDLIDHQDRDLCERLGIVREGRLTFAGLLLVGREEAIAEHAPAHEWKYVQLRSDTDYETAPIGGREAMVMALDKIMLVLGQANPVTIEQRGFFHPEFPRYPTVAIREALLNAFAHRDYSMPGMVFIRHYKDRLEITSPGSFVGGVTPKNILHHAPATRNRYFVDTVLQTTRLVNRSNLGVSRMFGALLAEGKEPPRISEIGQSVWVTFVGQDVDQPFKNLVTLLAHELGAPLDVDDLLLLHFFRRRGEAHWDEIVEAYPYGEDRLKNKLASLEHRLLMIEHDTGPEPRYRLSKPAATLLTPPSTRRLARRLDKEVAKLRIVGLLRERPLRNEEIRAVTNLARKEATRLMQELQDEGRARNEGRGIGARWYGTSGVR